MSSGYGKVLSGRWPDISGRDAGRDRAPHHRPGLIPVPLRNVAVLAMELATLQRMFPRRLRVGVGHGVQDWMGQVETRVTSLSLMQGKHRVEGLLNGDTVSMKDYITLNEVALDWPPSERMPILVGAIGPKTLQLAGELADKVCLVPTSPFALRRKHSPSVTKHEDVESVTNSS